MKDSSSRVIRRVLPMRMVRVMAAVVVYRGFPYSFNAYDKKSGVIRLIVMSMIMSGER